MSKNRLVLLVLAIHWLNPQGAGADNRKGNRPPKNNSDSAVVSGAGFWTAPALPRLISGDLGQQQVDTLNYAKQASGTHVHFETRLFYPLEGLGFPLGIAFKSVTLITESPTFSFTVSKDKAKVRPRHLLLGQLGVRSDFLLSGTKLSAGLDGLVSRLTYISANLTVLGPVLSGRWESDDLFSSMKMGSVLPIVSIEGIAAPYLWASGFDNRLVTDGAGVQRNLPVTIQLASSSTAQKFGVQIEVGGRWTDAVTQREHLINLGWVFDFTNYNSVIRQVSEEEGGQLLTVGSMSNSFVLGLRSNFL